MSQWPEVSKALGFSTNEVTANEIRHTHQKLIVPFESYVKLQPLKDDPPPTMSMKSMKSMKSLRSAKPSEEKPRDPAIEKDLDPTTTVILDNNVVDVDSQTSSSSSSSSSTPSEKKRNAVRKPFHPTSPEQPNRSHFFLFFSSFHSKFASSANTRRMMPGCFSVTAAIAGTTCTA